MTVFTSSLAVGIKTKMLLNFTGAEFDVATQILNDSTSGYEVIGNTNPYSTHQSIHEYDIMNDFHSNILHDSSNSDLDIPTICNGTSCSGACNFLPPSNHVPQTSNLNEIDNNKGETTTPSQPESPENTKPVFRKTPLPWLIRNSKDSSLTLLPFYQRNKNLSVCNSIDSFEGRIVSTKLITTDNERNNILATEISNSCNYQHTCKGTAANESQFATHI